MSQETSKDNNFKSIESLIEVATSNMNAKLPEESHQSYPLPVRTAKGLRIVFIYCPSVLRPAEGLWLIAPTHLVNLDARSGELVTMESITPAYFGINDKEGKVLGRYNMLPEKRTPEEFFDMRGRLYRDFDGLIEPFSRGKTTVPKEIQAMATEFKNLFSKVSEEPLLIYYEAIGKEFFEWLKIVSR